MAGSDRDALGRKGEALAEAHLRRAGLKTLLRRFRTPAGEIDLVMRDRAGTLVFVEVKTQTDDTLLDPAERVTPTKQTRLIRAARWLAVQRGWTDDPCRFDVVSVTLAGPAPSIRHDADAFTPRNW